MHSFDTVFAENYNNFKNKSAFGSFLVGDHFYTESVEVGGASGGSCWGSEASPYTVDYVQPEPLALIEFLKAYYPSVSFLTYRDLLKAQSCKTHCQREYYGNYTEYQVWKVSRDQVCEILKRSCGE